MTTWKLTLEYDGTGYHGWQEQTNAKSVAGELRAAAEEIFGGRVELQGSGRTDSGVHAIAQVAHLRAEGGPRNGAELVRALNERLPASIVILKAEEASPRFHARHDATERSYVYRISLRKSAFEKKYVWWIKEPLDIGAMNDAAQRFIGRHDFSAFAQDDPSKPGESTTVVVNDAGAQRDDNLVLIRIVASHFLWRMVRRLVGVLVRIGRGELSLDELDRFLDGEKDPRIATWTAPAAGLFLEAVTYGEPGAAHDTVADDEEDEIAPEPAPAPQPAPKAPPKRTAVPKGKPIRPPVAFGDKKKGKEESAPPPKRARPEEREPRFPRGRGGDRRSDDRRPEERRFEGKRRFDDRPPAPFGDKKRGKPAGPPSKRASFDEREPRFPSRDRGGERRFDDRPPTGGRGGRFSDRPPRRPDSGDPKESRFGRRGDAGPSSERGGAPSRPSKGFGRSRFPSGPPSRGPRDDRPPRGPRGPGRGPKSGGPRRGGPPRRGG